jgi:1-pyrroline-5-carboxylate dehydrogenase
MQLWQEAGLPDGVINFIPGDARAISECVLDDKNLAGIHFTGSTEVFNHFWKKVGENIDRYGCYPRIVGETGGKNFIMVHPSADVDQVTAAVVRGAFEYQGQKCSATSRGYLPASRSKEMLSRIVEQTASVRGGSAEDPESFLGAAIDKAAVERIKGYLDYIKASPEAEILCGGGCDDSIGYFVEPTVVVTTNPDFKTMKEEIFGPIITFYVYEDTEYDKALDHCANASEYSLTARSLPRTARTLTTPKMFCVLPPATICQRQKHRFGRRAKSVRRQPRLRHQRQSRQSYQHAQMGQPARDKREF